MAEIALIGDEATVLGLRLAGIKKSYVAGKGNVDEIFRKAENEADIIVITSGLYNALKKRESDKIIIQIPDREVAESDVVKKLVKDVIGFEIKT
jgi:vacuolar-type H+-ATPase subunit F/Vma7